MLKTNIDQEKWVKRLWRLHLHPWFLARSALTLRTAAQWNLAWRGVLSLLGHVMDYKASGGKASVGAPAPAAQAGTLRAS